MNTSSFHCERCGAALPDVDAVCPHCEQELSTPPVEPTPGKYRCPACGGRFDEPAQTWVPRNAPWYRPQVAGAECPHCSTLLRDRKRVHHSATEIAAVWLLIFASGFSPWRPGTQIVLLVVYLAVEFVRWHKARSAPLAQEDRFAAVSGGS